MSKLSIDYSVNDLVFRSRQFHISWVSQNNSIEWQTNDAPTIHVTGGLIEWVIFESILASLNKLLSSNQNHYEGFRYFRDLFVDLTPDTEISRSNELRTQIECRLPDELSDLEFNVVNSDYPLTDLLGFYLYFSSYLPNVDFPIIGNHFIIVELSKQSELIEQIAIPTALEPRWLNWKSLTSLDSHVFIELIKKGFKLEHKDNWFYIDNGYDLHILSTQHWTLWISGQLSEWEIALAAISILQEIYALSDEFEENLKYIKQRCSVWHGSRVEVNLV